MTNTSEGVQDQSFLQHPPILDNPEIFGSFLMPISRIQELSADNNLPPDQKWPQIAEQVSLMGPLPVKLIQLTIPFLRLQGVRSPETQAMLQAFDGVRTDFGPADQSEMRQVINRLPVVQTGQLVIDQEHVVGRASVSEVYRATSNRYPKKELVAKVQRHDAKEKFDSMFGIIKTLTGNGEGSSNRAKIFLDLTESVLRTEFDTGTEMDALDRLRSIGIKTPKVYRDLSNGEIITIDYIQDGVPLSEAYKNSDEKQRRKMAGRYIAGLVRMLVKGTLHGDPHGGNVLIRPDGKQYWIDPSPVSDINIRDVYRLIKVLTKINNNNRTGIIDSFNQLSLSPKSKKDLKRFKIEHQADTENDFYQALIRDGMIPQERYVVLGKSLAVAAGTVAEVLPKNPGFLWWAKTIGGAVGKSLLTKTRNRL